MFPWQSEEGAIHGTGPASSVGWEIVTLLPVPIRFRYSEVIFVIAAYSSEEPLRSQAAGEHVEIG
jgi:hypothetical protein